MRRIREMLRLQAEGIASARSPAVWAVRARACRFACGGPSVQGSHQLAVPVAKYWSEWQDLNPRPPRMGQSWPEVLVVGRPYQGKNNVLADSRGHAI